jgi:hypothetical protein
MTLLQKVAFIIKMKTKDGDSYEDSFLNLIGTLNLPPTFSDEEPDIEEDLDFENFAFSKVEEDEIVFSAGGDWQNGLIITLRLNESGDIVIAKSEKGFEDDYSIKFQDIIESVK